MKMKSVAVLIFVLTCLVIPVAVWLGIIMMSMGGMADLLISLILLLLPVFGSFIYSIVGLSKKKYDQVVWGSSISMAIMLMAIIWFVGVELAHIGR